MEVDAFNYKVVEREIQEQDDASLDLAHRLVDPWLVDECYADITYMQEEIENWLVRTVNHSKGFFESGPYKWIIKIDAMRSRGSFGPGFVPEFGAKGATVLQEMTTRV